MTVLEIYERIRAVKPIGQRQFFNALNDTVAELVAMYGEIRLLPYTAVTPTYYATKDDFPDVGVTGIRYTDFSSGLTYLWGGTAYASILTTITTLTDTLNIDAVYHIAIVDNILFSTGAGDIYKSEFMRKSKEAFNRAWSIKAKGLKVKRARW